MQNPSQKHDSIVLRKLKKMEKFPAPAFLQKKYISWTCTKDGLSIGPLIFAWSKFEWRSL